MASKPAWRQGGGDRPARSGLRGRLGWGDAFGILACLAATALRTVLDPALPPGFPYLTFFPAVVLTTYLYGLRPGIACAVLSGIAAWYFFIPPFHTFALTGHIVVALAFYAFVVVVDIALIHGLRRSADRLRSSKDTIQDLHGNLERLVAERTRELQRATALKGAVLDHAAYAVIATDTEGVITLFNPAAERLLGYAAADLVGRETPAIFHDARQVEERAASLSAEIGEPVAPGFEAFVLPTRRGRPNVREWTYVTKRGERIPALLTISRIPSVDGAELGFIGIAMDLREQYRHEAELRAASAGTWRVDVGSGRVWFSAECARQHGLGDAPVELHIEREWSRLAHPSDAPRAIEDLRSAISDGGGLRTEFRVPSADGSVKWLMAIGNVERDAQGVPVRVMGLTFDVTASKETEIALRDSEQRYRMLADNTADMIVQSDVDTTRRYVSPACRKLLGYEPRELIGTKPLDMVHPDDVADVQATFGDLRERRVDTTFREQRYRRKDGSYVWVEVHYQRMDDGSGETTGFMACVRDISFKHAQAEALNDAKSAAERARIEAEQASQSKTDFLAAMSHEIRTPLNAVIGFTDLMIRSGRLDADLGRHADIVRSSGAHLLGVVDDILDFSKVEAGAVELQRAPFSPCALLEDCLAMVREAGQAKGLDLGLVVDPGLPPAMLGDGARLRQILLNLLNNAVKFTREGGVTLSVLRVSGSISADRIRFSVDDTGIGIPGDKLGRLFQRFSQVDGSIQRDFGGTGLGLAIAKRLVGLMDGEIGVSSREGHGSTFWFEVTLPVATAGSGSAADGRIAAPGRKAKLLLVEDNTVNQELARAVLADAGHSVDVVGDGAAAVRAVALDTYDLVLMDIHMPGMDGMTATRKIRGLAAPRCRIPIIAMTANVLPEQIRRFREAGLDDHVGKPIRAEILHATIQKWIGGDDDIAEIAFDQATYDGVHRALSPGGLVGVLSLMVDELDVRFDGPCSTPDDRSVLREEAHSSASSAGMIGFLELASACHVLDGSSEEWVAVHGQPAFEARLGHVRTLASGARQIASRLLGEAKAGSASPDPFPRLQPPYRTVSAGHERRSVADLFPTTSEEALRANVKVDDVSLDLAASSRTVACLVPEPSRTLEPAQDGPARDADQAGTEPLRRSPAAWRPLTRQT